ncbi:MAG: (Fe-S)-binding protein [Desulforhopalus sp.]
MSGEKADKCGKCGFCLAVCPVHSVLTEEQASPRAKVQLIRAYNEGKLPSSYNLKDLISRCLMCGSCTASCPSEVDHYSQFMQMRAEMIKEHGDKIEIKGLVYLLAREQRLKLAASIAKIGQDIVPNAFSQKYKLANIPINKFPRLNKKALRSSAGENNAPIGRERGTVLYFTGCATNYIYDETGYSTIDILTQMGYRVIIPQSQTCCSIPMLFHGAEEKARENILKNVQCFDHEDIEAIIVDCPTCGSALKNEYPRMMHTFGYGTDTARAISNKVIDIMSFVYDRQDLLHIDSRKASQMAPVAYHAPCHLKNSFSPSDRLLQELKDIHYLPATDTMECCGGGGTFFYEYPEISGILAGRKIANVRKTDAEIWLTDCPVCRINLSGQLSDNESIQMMHPIQFLHSIMVAVATAK